MKTIQELKYLIYFYLGSLVFLLLAVISVPLAIQHGVTVTRSFIIEEDILETSLIVLLLVVSCFILRTFKHLLYAYEREVNRAGIEKSKLISHINEAFNYIGTLNVELHEIKSFFCELEHYPQTKSEFKLLIDDFTTKAMTVAKAPWILIRIISRDDGHTIKEYTITRPNKTMPSISIGNKATLENRNAQGCMKIVSCQKNLDLIAVAILPEIHLSEEEKMLVTAILNQIEIHYILYHSGALDHHYFDMDTERIRIDGQREMPLKREGISLSRRKVKKRSEKQLKYGKRRKEQ